MYNFNEVLKDTEKEWKELQDAKNEFFANHSTRMNELRQAVDSVTTDRSARIDELTQAINNMRQHQKRADELIKKNAELTRKLKILLDTL